MKQNHREMFDRMCEMEEQNLLGGTGATEAVKALPDRELEEHRQNPEAGSSWNEVEGRLRQSSHP